jgi:hypothetical protein
LISYATQTTPNINPPIAFNVSHDNALVAMAFGQGDHEPPVFRVGVDIMKVEFPRRQPFPEFVRIFGEQVNDVESVMLTPATQTLLFGNSLHPLKLAQYFPFLRTKAFIGSSGYGR